MISGTSVDSIDGAICYITEENGRINCRLDAFHEFPVPGHLRERIFQAFADGTQSLSLACSLNFEIAEAFAAAAKETAQLNGIGLEALDAIASHGQTVYHIAPFMIDAAERFTVPSTLQLGDASVLAARTGVPVVNNFRPADMAAGGNGAPLVPFADFHMFGMPGRSVLVHNLGGIANCTYLPASQNLDEIIAFDTGPANMIIDALVSHFYPGEYYDNDGGYSRQGKIIPQLLDRLIAIPFISLPPPKSTGRELFGVQLVREILETNPDARPNDLIATATEFTALSTAMNIRQHVLTRGPVDELLLAGGGAKNPILVEQIRTHLRDHIPVVDMVDKRGCPSKARECMAFAILGYAFLREIPGNVPAATGAAYRAVLGSFTPPPQRTAVGKAY